MASSTVIRPGKSRKSSPFLRQFPGKRRFERVSEQDWEASLPVRDIAGWGHIGRLEADVRVWRPSGELVSARKFPSRSYIRNFARILRNMFGQAVQLVDRNGSSLTTLLNSASGAAAGTGLIPSILIETTNGGSAANPEDSGASFAIGDGVAAEVHTRNDLVNRVSGIISARQGLVTTVLNTSTTTLQVTAGIVNGSAASVNVTEIGMYLFIINTSSGASVVPWSTLLAYDGITSTPVAAGGVIAPRYTLDFPV
jgi:hypothetical protein